MANPESWSADRIARWHEEQGSSLTMCGRNKADVVSEGHAGCLECAHIHKTLLEDDIETDTDSEATPPPA